MMHLGCARRLLSTACPRRTARIDKLPDGYRADKIIAALKASPVESVIPLKNHLLLRFFDESTARRCVEGNVGGYSVRMDEEPEPRLSAYVVAALGLEDASRTLSIMNPPKEKRALLGEMEGLQWTRIENGRFEYRFWGVVDACRVFSRYNAVKGAVFIFVPDDKDEYMFPSWYPRGEFLVGKVERNVLVSNIQNGETLRILGERVAEFDAHGFLLKAHYERKTKAMKVVLATSGHAKQFLEACKDLGDVELSYQEDNDPRWISRGMITALTLGARRSISLSVPSEHRSSMTAYRSFFSQYGALRPQSSEDDGPEELRLHFESILGAMKAVMLTEATFEGASITFLGARDLAPYRLTHVGRRQHWRLPVP
ncbi:uncharacterized protein EV420DRAFT_1569109 [Desarmillaria tabescens]|uniref:Uncharacterized protein n=1 Tax=Armillaria tabescens TaxID=1929756 RepID=A0AA39JSC7_ARMTA|nr:uncharacterized protein EV420DRAFT_1569109 [Desarmillaria tabescens]KAK0446951.1 hypothetical protein EV420DRAFT_1569109 [Desarmillaria tabescens]